MKTIMVISCLILMVSVGCATNIKQKELCAKLNTQISDKMRLIIKEHPAAVSVIKEWEAIRGLTRIALDSGCECTD